VSADAYDEGVSLGCEERIQRYLENIVIDKDTGCWLWRGGLTTHGYARVQIGEREPFLHRLFYERFVGAIGTLNLHHTCHVRHCLYPNHLRPVTRSEHMQEHLDAARVNLSKAWEALAEKHRTTTHCRNGHEYTEENMHLNPRGHRTCRVCDRNGKRLHRRKNT
jgi:hypothetical protein